MSRKPSTRIGQRVRFVLWAILAALLAWDFSALVVAVLMWVLLGTTGSDRNIVAAVSTTSVLLFCVAWQNRDGPGEVCRVETLFRVFREVEPVAVGHVRPSVPVRRGRRDLPVGSCAPIIVMANKSIGNGR